MPHFNSSTSCIIAAVIVLTVLIIAVCVTYRAGDKKPSSDDFMPGDAATPKLREAVALISNDLGCISRVSDNVKIVGKQIEDGDYGQDDKDIAREAQDTLTSACQGMAAVVTSAKRLKATVDIMTPTYQNVLGLYQGLRDSDTAIWKTAHEIDLAAGRLQALVTDDTNGLHQEMSTAAVQLRQISSCFYRFIRSIHYLGNALQLE